MSENMQQTLFEKQTVAEPPSSVVQVDPLVSKPFRVLDLFSGIGGFSLGLERTGGFKTVAFCEIDPFCREILNKHWPDVPILGDIKSLKGDEIECDVITAGFPCQPFSTCGRERGTEDSRHLWPEVIRIVGTARPAWAIFENVYGLIRLGLDIVQSDLEREGYNSRAVVLPSCATGKNHRRDRVFIVAHSVRGV